MNDEIVLAIALLVFLTSAFGVFVWLELRDRKREREHRRRPHYDPFEHRYREPKFHGNYDWASHPARDLHVPVDPGIAKLGPEIEAERKRIFGQIENVSSD